MNKLATFWPVIFRAFLYFLLAVLPVYVAALYDCLKGNAHWVALYGWWVSLSALYQGCLALRAFYDGTAQRHSDALNGTNPLKAHPETETKS